MNVEIFRLTKLEHSKKTVAHATIRSIFRTVVLL